MRSDTMFVILNLLEEGYGYNVTKTIKINRWNWAVLYKLNILTHLRALFKFLTNSADL